MAERKDGKRTTHNTSELIGSDVTNCECGEDHAARIREGLVIRLIDEEYEAPHHPWRHDSQEQAKQHLRDEAAFRKESSWHYNDVTSGYMTEQ